jgi:hypothetical protein
MGLVQLVTTIGVLTTYAGQYVGQPLYCDDGRGMVYDHSRAFIALPVTEYTAGVAMCGDWVRVTSQGHSFWALALDAGPLELYHVIQYGNLPIIADVPEHLWPFSPAISAEGTVFNESAFNRMCRECAMGHLR